jgi:zinc/manganese transport system substrate-binding protein
MVAPALEFAMGVITRAVVAVGSVFMLAASCAAHEQRLTIVAAENVYGEIARQITGSQSDIASIINKPDQDPHFFELTPSTLRLVSGARIVMYNGANYDPWMGRLVSATPRARRIVINVAELAGRKDGDNPHLWYSLTAIRSLAHAIADACAEVDTAHAADYLLRQQDFVASLVVIEKKIAQVRELYGGVAITATEPVFGYMADALGLEMRNERFQLAVMNGNEPSVGDIAAFEQDIQDRKVKLLLFNKQTSTELTQRMLEVARRMKIPVVGITELQPPGMSYQHWMLMQLEEVQKALAGSI